MYYICSSTKVTSLHLAKVARLSITLQTKRKHFSLLKATYCKH